MTNDITLNLGASKANLSLIAECLNATAQVIVTYTSGYIEIGGGSYYWSIETPAGTAIIRFKTGSTILASVSVDEIATAPENNDAPTGVELSPTKVASMIRYGERVTFIPKGGTQKQFMAIVDRLGNNPSETWNKMGINNVTLLFARDTNTGTLYVEQGADKFKLRPQKHLSEREYAITAVTSGDNWYQVVCE